MQFKIKLYGFTNELLGKIKGSVFPSDIPESELSDHFSSFFDQKIASICTELYSQPVVDSYISPSFVGSELCSFEPVSQEFVRKFICDSAPNCCVLDPIPTTLLKKCLDDLVPLICRIVNDSLLSGSVPRQFKEAVVIPLLKKKNTHTQKKQQRVRRQGQRGRF